MVGVAVEVRELVGKERFEMMKTFGSIIGLVFATATAMVGYTIHGGIFWTIFDFFFSPLVWCKWLVLHQVSLTIIRSTFDFFLK